MANKKPSLHKKSNNSSLRRGNAKPSLYKGSNNSRNRARRESNIQSSLNIILTQMLIKIGEFIRWVKRNPKTARNIFGILIAILIVFFLVGQISNMTNNGNDNNNIEKTSVPSTFIGSNSIGSVYKEGPYGNENSDVKIGIILGVHPREQGAHRLMEQALKERSKKLNCSYYLYKINVSADSTNFEQSRMNGQLLAQEFVVPDMIENNITFAVDSHYSNGHWGVSRFIFTPRENNTLSNQLAHAICNNFEWIDYYTPPDPTSPKYVTEPLNDGGVPAIIYEAYTEDDNNVTLDHDKQIIDYIDNWNFTEKSKEKKFFFF